MKSGTYGSVLKTNQKIDHELPVKERFGRRMTMMGSLRCYLRQLPIQDNRQRRKSCEACAVASSKKSFFTSNRLCQLQAELPDMPRRHCHQAR